jgi:hypothetical protein
MEKHLVDNNRTGACMAYLIHQLPTLCLFPSVSTDVVSAVPGALPGLLPRQLVAAGQAPAPLQVVWSEPDWLCSSPRGLVHRSVQVPSADATNVWTPQAFNTCWTMHVAEYTLACMSWLGLHSPIPATPTYSVSITVGPAITHASVQSAAHE